MQGIHTMKVRLPGGDKVNAFVNITSRYPFSIHLGSGRYRINAKSLIGIFSLDLEKTLSLQAECSDEEADALFQSLQPFSVADGQNEKQSQKQSQKFSLFGNK